MTEAEWLACGDPTALIKGVPQVSQRKGELFVVACCRQHESVLRNPLNRKPLLAIEDHADGLLTDEELRARRGRGKFGWRVASACSVVVPAPMFVSLASFLCDDPGLEQRIQLRVLRDIFGNPFRLVTFDPAWCTDTAVALADQMYGSRDFGAMHILADALQDAGCDSDDVLGHCRGPGPHVRGCWVVDLVLGKA
jgi:hypothetical protein